MMLFFVLGLYISRVTSIEASVDNSVIKPWNGWYQPNGPDGNWPDYWQTITRSSGRNEEM